LPPKPTAVAQEGWRAEVGGSIGYMFASIGGSYAIERYGRAKIEEVELELCIGQPRCAAGFVIGYRLLRREEQSPRRLFESITFGVRLLF